jgi:hypothetical protein
VQPTRTPWPPSDAPPTSGTRHTVHPLTDENNTTTSDDPLFSGWGSSLLNRFNSVSSRWRWFAPTVFTPPLCPVGCRPNAAEHNKIHFSGSPRSSSTCFDLINSRRRQVSMPVQYYSSGTAGAGGGVRAVHQPKTSMKPSPPPHPFPLKQRAAGHESTTIHTRHGSQSTGRTGISPAP